MGSALTSTHIHFRAATLPAAFSIQDYLLELYSLHLTASSHRSGDTSHAGHVLRDMPPRGGLPNLGLCLRYRCDVVVTRRRPPVIAACATDSIVKTGAKSGQARQQVEHAAARAMAHNPGPQGTSLRSKLIATSSHIIPHHPTSSMYGSSGGWFA